jgi:hypothetical protein
MLRQRLSARTPAYQIGATMNSPKIAKPRSRYRADILSYLLDSWNRDKSRIGQGARRHHDQDGLSVESVDVESGTPINDDQEEEANGSTTGSDGGAAGRAERTD